MREEIVAGYRSDRLRDVCFGEKSSVSPFTDDPSTYNANRFISVDWREVHARRKFHIDMPQEDRGDNTPHRTQPLIHIEELEDYHDYFVEGCGMADDGQNDPLDAPRVAAMTLVACMWYFSYCKGEKILGENNTSSERLLDTGQNCTRTYDVGRHWRRYYVGKLLRHRRGRFVSAWLQTCRIHEAS